MTPDPEKVREIAREAADLDYCSHADYPIQVTLTLLDGDVDVKHDQCGRIVQTDWPYLRADHVPLELVHATDGNEDWLELRLRSDEQPKAKPTRLPLPDRLDLIAQHLAPATEELRGLHGASHARLLVAAAIGSLRWVVDDLRGEKRPDEQPQDEGVTDAVPYPQLPTNAEFADILANGSADAELMAFRRLVATTGLNRAYRKWSMLLRAGEHAEYQEEIDRLIGEAVKAQAERDADVRAVARLLRELRINNPGVSALKAVTRVEERFGPRIAELREHEGGEEA